jgi:hypothetical protein
VPKQPILLADQVTASFEIREQNTVLFNNMITSLLEGRAESFRYWRDRLYSTGVRDAQEYVARLLHAVYAAGVLAQCSGGIPRVANLLRAFRENPDAAIQLTTGGRR